MDKIYDQTKVEQKWYKFWEESGFFKPEIHPNGKPYTIIMPPPNANESLHIGHARFVTVEDVLIRYHRMKGESALWLPGTDHAGIETQFVFEKKLSEEGKSRFDYDRKTLYQLIWDYVQKYKYVAVDQMKKLGASADWSREKFTLDPDIVTHVNSTFSQMVKDNLIYRGETLVNYCVYCGTSYSELEVDHKERTDEIYTLDYGPIKIATTRPETIFADVAVAVHPDDSKYKDLVGKTATIPIINTQIPIIADERVDKGFGTGAVKITPAHDKTDFDIGRDHNLEVIKSIDETGRMLDIKRVPQNYHGLKVNQARKQAVEELGDKLLETKPLTHSVGVCYRCKNIIEPMLSTQWFIKIRPIAEKAIEAVKKGETKITASRYEKLYLNWLENLRDWNISRQIVWGIRIPAWYEIDNPSKFYIGFVNEKGEYTHGKLNELLDQGFKFEQIVDGLVTIKASPETKWVSDENKQQGKTYLQETDTFDTWFSSGQWPVITLKTNQPNDFEKFYPTNVMETAYDILIFWVVRMMMFGLYLTNKAPFEYILLHGLVRDAKGEKISKSKGNVIDPLVMAEKYGTDALRMGLSWGALVENDVALSEENIKGQRNFTNKLWNIGRFIIDFAPDTAKHLEKSHPEFISEQQNLFISASYIEKMLNNAQHDNDKEILNQLSETIKKVTNALDQFRLNEASEELYDFIWHKFADVYIEKTKNRRAESQPILEYVYKTSLELLHPFMPFITEEIWQKLPHQGESIMIAPWPTI